jgi:hypothetical protein
MLYRLIYLTGPRTGQRVTVETEPMTMGRSPECAVVLEDPEAAAQHAEIVHRGDAVFVRDLGSMHRILVNQREVTESRLKHGDQLEVARTRFLVQCCVQAEVRRAAPPRRRLRRLVRTALPLLLAAAGLTFWRSRTGPDRTRRCCRRNPPRGDPPRRRPRRPNHEPRRLPRLSWPMRGRYRRRTRRPPARSPPCGSSWTT